MRRQLRGQNAAHTAVRSSIIHASHVHGHLLHQQPVADFAYVTTPKDRRRHTKGVAMFRQADPARDRRPCHGQVSSPTRPFSVGEDTSQRAAHPACGKRFTWPYSSTHKSYDRWTIGIPSSSPRDIRFLRWLRTQLKPRSSRIQSWPRDVSGQPRGVSGRAKRRPPTHAATQIAGLS